MLFPCKAGSELAQAMQIVKFKGAWVETLPSLAGPHGRSSNQELSTRAAQRVAQKLKTGPFLSFLNDQLEVDKSGKWVVGVLMIITNLLQKGAEDGMFSTSNSGSACQRRHDPMVFV